MFIFNLHKNGDFITYGEIKEDSENRIRAIPENIDRLSQIYDSIDILEILCNQKVPPLRGTGRTTRMLAEAKELAKSGKAVYVIAATQAHVRQLEEMIGADMRNLGIKIEVPRDFCWDQMRLLGAHPNCVVLVDHYTIEMKYAPILRMLHKYD
jgi:hypothetical protein